jgi:outer membrane protein TolC
VRRWHNPIAWLAGTSAWLVSGCATPDPIPVHHSSFQARESKPELPDQTAPANTIQLASAQESLSKSDTQSEPSKTRPAYAQLETLPIDLPTVIRLVDENSPAIGFARAKVREAQARLDSAEVQWLPNLSVGTAYNRFDGQTQNQRGELFGVSRANLFGGGGPALSLDFADAIYRPLIERRQTSAERFRERAIELGAELEAVVAYLDLVQLVAHLAINAETIQKAEAMLSAATNAREAKLDRTSGDVQRAQSEVLFRKIERIELEGKVGAASARLGRLLLLPPNVKLVPAETAIRPMTLIDPNSTLDHLLELALANRPDLAANREVIAAAWQRIRRAERGPLFPKLVIANQTGSYGGGLNDDLTNFKARNALAVQLYWEVKNFGFGNRADAGERRAQFDQAQLQLLEAQARVTADIVEAAQVAAARYDALALNERAIKEATELYRISREGTLNVLDAKNLFDALRPQQAIQILNQAKVNYLAAVLDFNRAQYRLFTLIGYPPQVAVESEIRSPNAK